MQEPADKLLTGQQASEFLGVKPATLYAYASRGLIESFPAPSARERCYRMSDLVRLRQASRGFKSVKDSEPAVWTGPVIKSAITEIREDGHSYRGHDALKLALSGQSFESVVELLWESESAVPFSWEKVKPLAVPAAVRAAAKQGGDYLDVLKLLLVSTEMNDPVCRKLQSNDVFETARRLLVTMSITPGLASGNDKFVVAENIPIAQTLLSAFNGSKSKEKAMLINRALVLCADHELNSSALAARVAASCDASLYSCLLSALGTFSGSLHGSASRRAEDLVVTSLKFKTARAWLQDYLRQSDGIPGFGTELYRQGDPRAKLLIEGARAVGGKSEHLARLIEIVEAVRTELGEEPNLDIGLAAISYVLDLPSGSGSTIFAVSRTAGWISHAIEQRLYGGLIRPRARYIGRADTGVSNRNE